MVYGKLWKPKNRHRKSSTVRAVVKLNGLWRSHHNATGTAARLEKDGEAVGWIGS